MQLCHECNTKCRICMIWNLMGMNLIQNRMRKCITEWFMHEQNNESTDVGTRYMRLKVMRIQS